MKLSLAQKCVVCDVMKPFSAKKCIVWLKPGASPLAQHDAHRLQPSTASHASMLEGLVTHFFARGKQLESSIWELCSNAHEGYHIVSTLGIMLTRQL